MKRKPLPNYSLRESEPSSLEPSPQDNAQESEDCSDLQQIYLRQMSKTPLLTREQEAALARELDDARNRCRRILHSFGFIARAYLETARRLLRGEERFDHR